MIITKMPRSPWMHVPEILHSLCAVNHIISTEKDSQLIVIRIKHAFSHIVYQVVLIITGNKIYPTVRQHTLGNRWYTLHSLHY